MSQQCSNGATAEGTARQAKLLAKAQEAIALHAPVTFDHTSTYSHQFVPLPLPPAPKVAGRYPWKPSGYPLDNNTIYRTSYVEFAGARPREPAWQGQLVPITHKASKIPTAAPR
jgi:hypothetical protein